MLEITCIYKELWNGSTNEKRFDSFGVFGKWEQMMLDILKFIFQDFWHWLGTLLIIIVISDGIAGILDR